MQEHSEDQQLSINMSTLKKEAVKKAVAANLKATLKKEGLGKVVKYKTSIEGVHEHLDEIVVANLKTT